MNNADKSPWVVWLEGDCLQSTTPEGFTVDGVVVRISHQGIMGIIKAHGDPGNVVCFVGARGLKGLSGEVRKVIKNGSSRWRKDQFA